MVNYTAFYVHCFNGSLVGLMERNRDNMAISGTLYFSPCSVYSAYLPH